jgi:outer membrane receptor protein involved in Fe transport
VLVGAFALYGLAAPPGFAQSLPAGINPTTDAETVVVNARKRGEPLADVPESITAFTAEDLQDHNIQTFNDYAEKTPNLSFSYGSGPTESDRHRRGDRLLYR